MLDVNLKFCVLPPIINTYKFKLFFFFFKFSLLHPPINSQSKHNGTQTCTCLKNVTCNLYTLIVNLYTYKTQTYIKYKLEFLNYFRLTWVEFTSQLLLKKKKLQEIIRWGCLGVGCHVFAHYILELEDESNANIAACG